MLRCLAADIERSLLGVEQEAAFCLVDALRLVAAAALAAMRLGVRQCAGARLFLGIVGGRVGLGFGLCGLLGLRHIGAEGGNCACATYVIFVVAGIESTHGKCQVFRLHVATIPDNHPFGFIACYVCGNVEFEHTAS